MNTIFVERIAKLLQTGSYPDRGVDITEEDLDRIVSIQQPVPIKVEHIDTPLKIGMLARVWRAGRDLMGKLILSKAAWDLIRESGARALSVGIRRDKSALAEVSLVSRPRIPDALLFSGETTTDAQVGCATDGEESASTLTFYAEINGKEDEMTEEKIAEFSERIAELEREIRVREVDLQIDSLKRAGKIVPAAEEAARALLFAGDREMVTFSDGSVKSVAETFLAFLNASPCIIQFSELAGGPAEPEMSDEEQEIFRKLGISRESASKYQGRQ